jgi:hypothetical protein
MRRERQLHAGSAQGFRLKSKASSYGQATTHGANFEKAEALQDQRSIRNKGPQLPSQASQMKTHNAGTGLAEWPKVVALIRDIVDRLTQRNQARLISS